MAKRSRSAVRAPAAALRASRSDKTPPRHAAQADRVPTSVGRAFADPVALCMGLTSLLIGLACARYAPWRAAAVSAPEVSPAAAPAASTLRRGPYGDLRATLVWITPPEELLGSSRCSTNLDPWVLPALRAPEQVDLWLRGARLPPATQAALLQSARCDEDKGCELRPDTALVNSLTREARAQIYNDLSKYAQNKAQYFAFRWSEPAMPQWLAETGLGPALRERFLARLYPREGRLHFSDIEGVCAQLDPGERGAFIRALNATRGHLLQLQVPEGPPPEELVAYWGAGGREAEVRPLLTALGQHKGGASVDVAHLLPRFARERLFNFPAATDPAYNCHHSALNFFAQRPDDRLLDDHVIDEALRAGYQPVAGPPRLGDIHAIERPDGHAVHTMVHVAADYVFTKNGLYSYIPWTLAHLDDIRDIYMRVPSLRMVVYRRRASAP